MQPEHILFTGGGGVTFGGGEPTLQVDEVLEGLQLLRAQGIHTAVESNAATAGFTRVIGAVDLLICDIKCLDAQTLHTQTGADLELVQENLRQAAREQEALWVSQYN